jgi:hypothetical protein
VIGADAEVLPQEWSDPHDLCHRRGRDSTRRRDDLLLGRKPLPQPPGGARRYWQRSRKLRHRPQLATPPSALPLHSPRIQSIRTDE